MKHPGNSHHAKAQAYLRRAGYADGGAAGDDDQPTPMQQHQMHLDHIAARGDYAMAGKRMGQQPGPAGQLEDDIDNYADTFNSKEMGDQHKAINRKSPKQLREEYAGLDDYRRGGRTKR